MICIYIHTFLALLFLNKKLPLTNNPVQWFDVITNSDFEKDIAIIMKKKPKVIIMFDPPYKTYEGHEKLKADYLRQYEFLHQVSKYYDLKNYVIFKNSVIENYSILEK